MSTTNPNHQVSEGSATTPLARREPRRLSTETKSAFRTTELIVYILAVAGTIVTAAIVGNARGGGRDIFNAYQAMQLITVLTVGYLVSRGLAKAGSRDRFDA